MQLVSVARLLVGFAAEDEKGGLLWRCIAEEDVSEHLAIIAWVKDERTGNPVRLNIKEGILASAQANSCFDEGRSRWMCK